MFLKVAPLKRLIELILSHLRKNTPLKVVFFPLSTPPFIILELSSFPLSEYMKAIQPKLESGKLESKTT